MWAKYLEKVLDIVTTVLASYLSYRKGRSDVEKNQAEATISDATLSQKAELEIAASHDDAAARERLRQQSLRKS